MIGPLLGTRSSNIVCSGSVWSFISSIFRYGYEFEFFKQQPHKIVKHTQMIRR